MTPISRSHYRQATVRQNKGVGRLITFFLFLCLLIGSGSLILNQTILNQAYTTKALQKPAVAQKIATELNTMMLDAAQKNGLPQSVQVQLLTEADVQKDVDQTVANIYAGKSKPLDSDQMVAQMHEHLLSAVSDNSLLKDILSVAVTAVQAPLKTYIEDEIQTPYLTPIATGLHTAKITFGIMMWIGFLLAVVFAIVLWLVSGKLRFMLSSFGGSLAWSGVFLLLMTVAVKYSGAIGLVAQKAGTFNTVVRDYGLTTIDVATKTSLIVLISGAVIWIIGRIIQRVRA